MGPGKTFFSFLMYSTNGHSRFSPFSCCRPEQTATSSREPCLQPSQAGVRLLAVAPAAASPRGPGSELQVPPRGSSPHSSSAGLSGSAAHAACFISQPAGALSPGSSWIFTPVGSLSHLPVFPLGNICPSVYSKLENCQWVFLRPFPHHLAAGAALKLPISFPDQVWLDVASPWPAFLSVDFLKCLAPLLLDLFFP